jgi:hypothetical protein
VLYEYARWPARWQLLTHFRTHRGWYSFIVTTLAQAIYMFGFVQLIPQLIINYKLKSVAHMPYVSPLYPRVALIRAV